MIQSLVIAVLLISSGGPRQRSAFHTPGNYALRDGSCRVRISIASMGGFARLHLPVGRSRVIDDVSGAVFVRSHTVVYGVSPLYGRPGVFSYDCLTGRITRLVAPRTRDHAYSNGADWFEVVGWSGDRVYYLYSPDVDFMSERPQSRDSLFTVKLNGSGRRRATGDESRAFSLW